MSEAIRLPEDQRPQWKALKEKLVDAIITSEEEKVQNFVRKMVRRGIDEKFNEASKKVKALETEDLGELVAKVVEGTKPKKTELIEKVLTLKPKANREKLEKYSIDDLKTLIEVLSM